MSEFGLFQTVRPGGGRVEIAPDIRDRLLCGVLELEGVAVTQDTGAAQASEALGASLREIFTGRLPSKIPGLQEARALYKSFGVDPSRHRPSSEALLRRVLKGQSLYQISNVVDTCNLASLSFLLPIGMYDTGKLKGDVTLRVGEPGEEYPGIRKGPVHLEGRLGLFDLDGPFGSPTSDSARTCATDSTTGLLAVIMATPSYQRDRMDDNLGNFTHLFHQHCGAREIHRAVLGGTA